MATKSQKTNMKPLLVGAATIATVGGVVYLGRLYSSGVDLAYEIVSGESLKIEGGMVRGEIKFRLINRGPATLRVQQAALDVLVSGNELARIDTSMQTTIPARSSKTVVFPVESAILNSLFLLLTGWLMGGWTPEAKVVGFFRVSGVKVDVEENYDLSINSFQNSMSGLWSDVIDLDYAAF